jgi:hypothetical protein
MHNHLESAQPRSVAMSEVSNRPAAAVQALEPVEHPRGTLAIVCIFALLFAAGWLATYIWLFLERGAPHP